MDAWTRLNVDSTDVVAVQIEMSECILWIFNVYNACNHFRSMRAVEHFVNSAEGRRMQSRNGTDIWVGNFNRHHLMWDYSRNRHLFTHQI